MSDALLTVENIGKSFRARSTGLFRQPVLAVNDVSFSVGRGETLGLVGESGCGKSTLARLVLHLIEPDSGQVRLAGDIFTRAGTKVRRRLRRKMQIVFQDALSSLNPRMNVGVNVAEPLRLQGIGDAADRRDAARAMLERVGLRAQDEERYPHEFSGGQCQRIAIARALVMRPDLVVFDEAVSALDVSIRAQILRLVLDLQQQFGLSYIFISHDLGVVKRVSDRIAVMYLGRIVELGPADELIRAPLHPYTEALMRAIPVADPRRMRVRDLGITEGEAASTMNPPAGCAFYERCGRRMPVCVQRIPPLSSVGPRRATACFLHLPH